LKPILVLDFFFQKKGSSHFVFVLKKLKLEVEPMNNIYLQGLCLVGESKKRIAKRRSSFFFTGYFVAMGCF